MEDPKQTGFDLEPEYLEEHGMKFEFSGLLFTPAPGEGARIEDRLYAERRAKEKAAHAQVWESLTRPDHVTHSVKVDMKTALKFRAKGQ